MVPTFSFPALEVPGSANVVDLPKDGEGGGEPKSELESESLS